MSSVYEVNNRNDFCMINLNNEYLDLKIPVIENLDATLNQFNTIDFTNNNLCKLEGFPFLPKLKTLYLANNHTT